MAYYRITAPDNGENILMRRATQREIITTGGEYLNKEDLDIPVKIEMHAGENSGYEQYMPGFTGEVQHVPPQDRLVDYYELPPLMSKGLVEAIQQAGVDNLQTFPVNIEDVKTGETVNNQYLLVNVVGLISCAELDESNADPLGEVYHFYELKIDESKVHGQLLFRLAESPYEIIVESKIADIINSGKFKGIAAELVT